MWVIEIVEFFSLLKSLLEFVVTAVLQQMKKIWFISKVASFDHAIQIWTGWFYVAMHDATVLRMLMKLWLKFMTVVRLNMFDAKW